MVGLAAFVEEGGFFGQAVEWRKLFPPGSLRSGDAGMEEAEKKERKKEIKIGEEPLSFP